MVLADVQEMDKFRDSVAFPHMFARFADLRHVVDRLGDEDLKISCRFRQVGDEQRDAAQIGDAAADVLVLGEFREDT